MDLDCNDEVFPPHQPVQFLFDDFGDNSAPYAVGRISNNQSRTVNFNHGGIPRSSSSIPITIPGGGNRQPSQRHTNFTPPRSYMVAHPLAAKMVRSASAGSLPTVVSVLLGEHIRPGSLSGCLTEDCRSQRSSSRPIIADHYSKSVPSNFDRCALEQDIGLELRAISDCFHLECGGFKHGYDFKYHTSRIYSNSYPGCTRLAGQSTGWQEVVMAVSPNQCKTFKAFSRPDATRT